MIPNQWMSFQSITGRESRVHEMRASQLQACNLRLGIAPATLLLPVCRLPLTTRGMPFGGPRLLGSKQSQLVSPL